MEFTPETLRDLASQIEKMRFDMLMDMEDAGACPYAEQHYLVALGHLELAHRAMSLAHMSQSRALTESKRG